MYRSKVITAIFLLCSSSSPVSSFINETCLRERQSLFKDLVGKEYDSIARVPAVLDARIEDVALEERSGNAAVTVAHISHATVGGKATYFLHTTKLTYYHSSPPSAAVKSRRREGLDGDLVYLDWHRDHLREVEARARKTEDNSIVLTVTTTTAAEGSYPVTYDFNLSASAGHGPLPVDRTFGFFRFSPDGSTVAYTADKSAVSSSPFKGIPGGVTQPSLFFFSVEERSVAGAEAVPSSWATGHIHWHPDSR